MKKLNNTSKKRSVSEYCSDYINSFNARELTRSWKLNAIKVVAIAGVSSAVFSANDVQAQVFDCPPAFQLLENKGSLTNPQGLTTIAARSNPVFVDFDGDGDIDVVSGTGGVPASENIYFFENTGTNSTPNWAAPITAPNGLSGADLLANFGATNFAPSFADIDNDGDLDAFIGTFNAGILYQENIGTATAPNYAAAIANPFGASTGASLLTAPSLVDIDGDGDLDMFVGEVFNDIFFFENTGTASAPVFTAGGTNQFGLDNTFQVDYLPKLAFADLDNDGDVDAMIGGYYSNFTYFENTGTTTAPAFGTPELNPFSISSTGVYRTTASFADVDADGDFDLISGTADGDYVYYQNYGTATTAKFGDFAFDIANPLAAGDNATDYADLDGDGDLDLIVGDNDGDISFFENISPSASTISFAPPVVLFTAPDTYAHPTLTDLDGDGDFDMVVGDYNGDLHYYENTGTTTAFTFGAPVTNGLGLSGVDYYASPEFADMDGDGDQDLFVGNKDVGGLTYFENTGTATAPAFTISPNLPGLGATTDFGIVLGDVDIDNDGDLDFVYGSYGNITFYLNTGTPTSPSFTDIGNSLGMDTSLSDYYAPTVVDINQDGRYEAFVGAKNDNFLRVYEDKKVIPVISIVQGASISSCETNILSVSSTNVGVSDLTVEWYDSNNTLVFTGPVFTLTSLETDTYTAKAKVTATGCASNEPTVNVIKEEPVISIVEGSSISSCDINTLSISSTNFALSDLTVTWYNSSNVVVGTGSTLTLPSLDTETYSVKAESPTGCESNQPTVNVVKTLPIISVAEGSTVYSCKVNTLHAASSNYSLSDLTFEWRDASNNLVSTSATFVLTSLETQTYTLKATTVTGCETTTSVNVVKTVPVISVLEGSSVSSCKVPSLTATSSNFAIGDLTFEWRNASNVLVSTSNTLNLNPDLGNQTYRVTATSATGCESNTFVVNVSPIAPVISVTEGTSILSCEPVTLSVESSNFLMNDLTFTWYNKNNEAVATGTSYKVDPLALPQTGSKTFSVRGTSTLGCESNVVSVTVSCSDEASTTLTGTAGYNTAMLKWTSVGTRPIREYEIYGDPGQFGTTFLFGFSSTTSYEVFGLTNGQKVDFRVRPIYTDGKYGAYSNTITVKPSIVLGEDENAKAGFAFFPNPNNGEFNLRLEDGSNSATVSVTSISGQRVYTTTLNATQTSINLGNVASGMYIVRVETAKGTYQQKVSVVR